MEDNSRNIILMVVISLAIFLGYDYFYLRPRAEEAQRQLEAQQALAQEGAAAEARLDESLTPGAASGPAELASTPPGGARASAPSDLALVPAGYVMIDTPQLTGRLSLRGARLSNLALKNHKVTLDGGENVQILAPYGSDAAYYARFGWAAAGETADFIPTEQTAWTADRSTLTPGAPVTLSWTNAAGITYRTKIAVDENFLFTITQSISNNSDTDKKFAPYGLISRTGLPATDGLYILHEGPFGVFDGTFQEYSYDDFEDTPKFETASTGGWMGLTDKYWMTVLIPEKDAALTRAAINRKGSGSNLSHQVSFVEDWADVPAGMTVERTARLYAGAKEVDVIDTYADTYGIALFDRAIDWGWFYFLTRPIFFLLHTFAGLTGNFGVAIILLVVALKLALFPLANRQYTSMAHMKDAQPKIKAMQERFKDDKVRLQQEMMKLYKKEKINPLAGCLPLLPQIFIFFALYKVLYVTIDMRHEPFFGWIIDLSAPDPLTPVNLFGLIPWDPPSFMAVGVWPILMGLSMWLQQKLSPSTLEPAQQKIMMLMPIIFTFILANFSAGLVIYWTLNSLLSVLQQWVIIRRLDAAKTTKAGKA